MNQTMFLRDNSGELSKQIDLHFFFLLMSRKIPDKLFFILFYFFSMKIQMKEILQAELILYAAVFSVS